MKVIQRAQKLLEGIQPRLVQGRVWALKGLTLLVGDLPLPVGSLVWVQTRQSEDVFAGSAKMSDGTQGGVAGEVVGFDNAHAVVMLLGPTQGIRVGDFVKGMNTSQTVGVSRQMLGRCIDGLARPIDGKGAILDGVHVPLHPDPVPAMDRRRIDTALETGVRAIDLMTTLGRGQRLGIFAGPGVGKSTLLGMISRGSAADVNVIALIGERGREVRDFVEKNLGPEGMARSVVVVATSDESPLLRIRAAMVSCAIAEFFRDQGQDVLLVMDSVTRFAHAQRQVGLSVGEPPATKGYTPSVFALLPILLERAGAVEPDAEGEGGGSITGIYTILVEGDDMTEPVADAARGILDGHVILSRKLAQHGHYPAIDVLDSVSRVADDICDQDQIAARRQVMAMMARYAEVEDLVQIGAYVRGSNPQADVAIDYQPRINELLCQGEGESSAIGQSRSLLVKLAVESSRALEGLQGATVGRK